MPKDSSRTITATRGGGHGSAASASSSSSTVSASSSSLAWPIVSLFTFIKKVTGTFTEAQGTGTEHDGDQEGQSDADSSAQHNNDDRVQPRRRASISSLPPVNQGRHSNTHRGPGSPPPVAQPAFALSHDMLETPRPGLSGPRSGAARRAAAGYLAGAGPYGARSVRAAAYGGRVSSLVTPVAARTMDGPSPLDTPRPIASSAYQQPLGAPAPGWAGYGRPQYAPRPRDDVHGRADPTQTPRPPRAATASGAYSTDPTAATPRPPKAFISLHGASGHTTAAAATTSPSTPFTHGERKFKIPVRAAFSTLKRRFPEAAASTPPRAAPTTSSGAAYGRGIDDDVMDGEDDDADSRPVPSKRTRHQSPDRKDKSNAAEKASESSSPAIPAGLLSPPRFKSSAVTVATSPFKTPAKTLSLDDDDSKLSNNKPKMVDSATLTTPSHGTSSQESDSDLGKSDNGAKPHASTPAFSFAPVSTTSATPASGSGFALPSGTDTPSRNTASAGSVFATPRQPASSRPKAFTPPSGSDAFGSEDASGLSPMIVSPGTTPQSERQAKAVAAMGGFVAFTPTPGMGGAAAPTPATGTAVVPGSAASLAAGTLPNTPAPAFGGFGNLAPTPATVTQANMGSSSSAAAITPAPPTFGGFGGAPVSAASTAAATPVFAFGNAATPSVPAPSAIGASQPAPPSSGGFNFAFGPGSTPAASTAANELPKPFTFGATASMPLPAAPAEVPKPFTFGAVNAAPSAAAAPTAATSGGGFHFNAPNNGAISSSSHPATGPGAPTPTGFTFGPTGAAPTTAPQGFGGSSAAVAPQYDFGAPGGGFTFGLDASQQPPTTAAGAGGFGGGGFRGGPAAVAVSNAPAPPSFGGFGGPGAGAAPPSQFPFGAGTAPQPSGFAPPGQQPGGFTFGAAGGGPSAGGPAASGFTFGMGVGGAAQGPGAAGGNGFGGPPPGSFGGFGDAAGAQGPAGGAPGSIFGMGGGGGDFAGADGGMAGATPRRKILRPKAKK